ncbi:NAD(P)/FAD-dependent oxidoreductase [Streptomyces sp. NPDC094038]|uniref:NAD(P)/FAD-dependent oxidoreductase n=1 Tax=Streptomyces sp. NPDC094038 TaxID=3366055 RepID=UPI003811C059
MVLNAEVVVVGAGMFGSATAKYLARGGADVLVIGPEQPSRDGSRPSLAAYGAHRDEARIVRRLGWDQVWGTLDTRSADRMRALEAESGIGFLTECGGLALMGKGVRHRTAEMLRLAAAAGVTVEELSDTALGQEFPELALPPVAGGVDGLLERRSAGYLNPRLLVQAQLRLAAAAGARLLDGEVTVVSKEPSAGGRWLLRGTALDGGTIQARAEQVVVTTGALANRSGALPAGHRLDLHAFTEPNLLFEVPAGQSERLRDLPTVVVVDPEDRGNDNLSVYLLPPVRHPDGKWYVRIGPGMQPLVRELRTAREMLAWCTGGTITAEQAQFLTAMLRTLLPALEPVSVRPACCVVDKTPTRHPYIGPLCPPGPGEADGLFVAVGGNGHGARGSDEIGRLAATLVLGAEWDFPLPREVFAPVPAPSPRASGADRPPYLTPPFGLC